MLVKLNAEFESIDNAEFAAKNMKNKIHNLTSVTIKQKSVFNENKNFNDESYLIPFYNQNINSAVPAVKIDNDNYESEIIPSSKAVLEVICDIKSQNVVNQILLSNGGLKINKN